MKNYITIGFEESGWKYISHKEVSEKEIEYIFEKLSTDKLAKIQCLFFYPSKEAIIEEKKFKLLGSEKILFDGKLQSLGDLKILNRMLF